MMRHEFEALALRGNGQIGEETYKAIERFYMSENDYHMTHGGIYESKREFVQRVFGGKVNTVRMISEKIAQESIKENRYMLQGTHHSEAELKAMDKAIRDHYMHLYKYNW